MRTGLIFLTALLLAVPAAADNALEELRGFRTLASKVPLYSGRRLQLMVYAPESSQRGGLLVAQKPVMDIIRRSADITAITTGPETKVYPLGTELPELFQFWSARLFSEGLVSADHADIDQSSGHIVGDGVIQFRAPMLDLDGIGFDGDYLNRTLSVKKQIVALLRTDAGNPLKYLKNGQPVPALSNAARVTGDSLFMDFDKGEITLSGNIRINDSRMTGSCDRMVIRLKQNTKSDKKDDDLASAFTAEGVEEIELAGRVRLEAVPDKPDAPPQFATAARAVMRPHEKSILLTGANQINPVVRQGDNSLSGREIRYGGESGKLEVIQQGRMVYLREEKDGVRKMSRVSADRIDYDNHAGFGELTGSVTVDDDDMYLECGRGKFRLIRTPAEAADGKDNAGSLTELPHFSGGGELEQIICSEQVRMSRKDGARIAETATADQATLDWRTRVLTLQGGKPTIVRGADSLSAGRLVLHLEQEQLLAQPTSQVVLCSGDSAQSHRTVITSDGSNFDYGRNILIFEGNVKVRDARLNVDCRKMEILLKPDPGKNAGKSPEKSSGFGSGGGKVLEKIICTGDVHAREPRMDLKGDKVILHFAAVKDPEKAPTAFKSGNIALDRIDCDGHVRLEHLPDPNAPEPAKKTGNLLEGGSLHNAVVNADKATMILPENWAVFEGNVKVRETTAALDCRKLELFGRETREPAPPTAEEALDADPFAKVDVARAPKAIAIGDNRELDRVVASGDVDFTREVPTGTQRITGDKAVYVVDKRELVITGTPDQLPRFYDSDASRSGVAEQILVDLATEKIYLRRSRIEFEPGNFN